MHKPPYEIINILKSINSAGHDAFLVGGWVRDALLAKVSFDFDICTNAPTETLLSLFASYHPQKHASQFGGVSFSCGTARVEITQYRKESQYRDFRHPDKVEFVMDLKTDLQRRDFTINTLCYHPDEGIIDLLGGQKDLEQGILRCVNDPKQKFTEDVLRIVRLFRFQSQLGFTIESETHRFAEKLSPLLSHLNVADWKDEFFKLILGPSYREVALENPFLLGELIPELKEARFFDQLNPYHKYSLYDHSIRVSACLPAVLNLHLAGLFHDLGKLRTQVIDDAGIGHYKGHAHASAKLSAPYLQQLQLKKKDQEAILQLIAYHDYSLKEDQAAIYQFAYQHGVAFTRDLIALKRCDNSAKSDLALYQVDRCDVFLSHLEAITHLPLVVSDLKVNNESILERNIAQNQASRILKAVLDEVVLQNVGHDKARQEAILEGVIQNDIYQSK